MRGYAEDMYPAGGDLHHHGHVEPLQPDGVNVEDVGRGRACYLGTREGLP